MGSEGLVQTDKWRKAERLAELLDSVLRTKADTRERAEAVEDLAARLRRSPQTIRAYIRRYQKRRLVRDLLRDDSARGPRIRPKQEAILKTALEEKYLAEEAQSLHRSWIIANGRLEDAGLRTVSYNTLKGVLHRHWTEAEIARLREGKDAARPYRRRGGKLRPKYPLQICQMDETEIDVLARDDQGNLLKRLWLVVLTDVFTHAILGFWLWPRSPNQEAIGLCVHHAIRPKREYLDSFGLQHAMDIYGRPEKIITDRGAWYKALEGNQAVRDLRINIDPRRGEPHIRNVVERMQGAINQAIESLPGRTGSSPEDRGDYPAEKRAVLTFADIEEAVAIAAFRIVNGEMDEKTLIRPDQEWAKHLHLVPDHLLNGNSEEALIAFLPEVSKSLSSAGIRHFSRDYWDDADPRLRGLYANRGRAKLRVKINRNDISHIYLFDEAGEEWFAVPAADGDLRPLPEWEWQADRDARRRAAETSWSVRGSDRDRIDAIGVRAKRRTVSKAKRTRQDASDQVAAEVARGAPKPLQAEMERNRAKTSGSGFSPLKPPTEFYDVEDWSER